MAPELHEKASLPFGLKVLTAHVIADKIYAFGGYGMNGFDSRVQVYDPAADEWSEGTSMPTRRYIFTSELIDGKVYVLGGHAPTSQPSQPSISVLCLLLPRFRLDLLPSAYGFRSFPL